MDPKLLKEMFGIRQVPAIPLSLQDIPLKAQDMAGRMSISGMQPKLSLKLNKRQAELVIAPTGGAYILKPQIQQFPHTPENENCCMDIAGALGIRVPAHCLLPLNDGTLAYVVKRFDRIGEEKIHQEDFYQILEKKDKYLGSLEQIGNKLKVISAIPGLDVQLFYERVVFNFLIGNGDGHFKNYSISYPRQEGIRLSPAYDIVCSKLVIPNEEDSALTINGKKNNLTRNDFDAFAEYLKIPERPRYEKFIKKTGQIKQLITNSLLPEAFKAKLIEIVFSRYTRLKIQP
ncbi:MAG: HipA domain-containing protein [Candidatus Omnitrophica bacterium]|nr:HipA domain-containing protein [Candidatus Omnitrophota bacterium]MDD5670751.1 HipA domain-containing protein [Candidatus Omnitrophota bacterium]